MPPSPQPAPVPPLPRASSWWPRARLLGSEPLGVRAARRRGALGFVAGVAVGVLAAGLIATAAADPGDRAATRPPPAPAEHSRYAKLDAFARALTIIEQYYVRPVDTERLIHAAIRGIARELDPHTDYLDPEAARLLQEDIDGAFGGVGLVVNLAADDRGRVYIEVREVLARGPAAAAGVAVGDRIVQIDGRGVAQFPDLGAAVAAMRGREGTRVRVTLERAATGQADELVLTRARVEAEPVAARRLGQSELAVVRLRDFSDGAAADVRAAIEEIEAERGQLLRGIVLDLRDNGGGLLDEAIALADLFVRSGPLVRTRGRDGRVLDRAFARGPGTREDLGLVVLINKGTASAAEIVAGALQDHGRALIVGERSYGKGSVQAPFPIADGSVLKLTIALYYTPDDRLIQARGVAPDVHVGGPGAQESGGVAWLTRDTRGEIAPERAEPRHLRPEDFERAAAAAAPPEALDAAAAAGDDVQLRVAVQHLAALVEVPQARGIPRGRLRRR
jgi:carboxyl-terminal processing protease